MKVENKIINKELFYSFFKDKVENVEQYNAFLLNGFYDRIIYTEEDHNKDDKDDNIKIFDKFEENLDHKMEYKYNKMSNYKLKKENNKDIIYVENVYLNRGSSFNTSIFEKEKTDIFTIDNNIIYSNILKINKDNVIKILDLVNYKYSNTLALNLELLFHNKSFIFNDYIFLFSNIFFTDDIVINKEWSEYLNIASVLKKDDIVNDVDSFLIKNNITKNELKFVDNLLSQFLTIESKQDVLYKDIIFILNYEEDFLYNILKNNPIYYVYTFFMNILELNNKDKLKILWFIKHFNNYKIYQNIFTNSFLDNIILNSNIDSIKTLTSVKYIQKFDIFKNQKDDDKNLILYYIDKNPIISIMLLQNVNISNKYKKIFLNKDISDEDYKEFNNEYSEIAIESFINIANKYLKYFKHLNIYNDYILEDSKKTLIMFNKANVINISYFINILIKDILLYENNIINSTNISIRERLCDVITELDMILSKRQVFASDFSKWKKDIIVDKKERTNNQNIDFIKSFIDNKHKEYLLSLLNDLYNIEYVELLDNLSKNDVLNIAEKINFIETNSNIKDEVLFNFFINPRLNIINQIESIDLKELKESLVEDKQYTSIDFELFNKSVKIANNSIVFKDIFEYEYVY